MCIRKHSTISVAIAKGVHLFSYRTQKLSLSTQMVLGWTRPGRVCSRRIPKKALTFRKCFFLAKNAKIFTIFKKCSLVVRQYNCVRHFQKSFEISALSVVNKFVLLSVGITTASENDNCSLLNINVVY